MNSAVLFALTNVIWFTKTNVFLYVTSYLNIEHIRKQVLGLQKKKKKVAMITSKYCGKPLIV